MYKLVIKRVGMINPLVKSFQSGQEFHQVIRSVKERVVSAKLTTPSGLVKDVSKYFN